MDRRSSDLVLDVGNTRTKLALFHGERLVKMSMIATGDLKALNDALAGTLPGRIAVGSVASPDEALLRYLGGLAPTFTITGGTPTPLRSHYTTPHTLGVDRLANAVAAAAMFPGRPVLAVDLGTCITYDLVDAEGVHAGGAISPGLRMRARAMHAYSARLPEVEVGDVPGPWGTSTREALEAGIHQGVLGELQGFIRHAAYHAAGCAVVLTGGDAPVFARACKSGIFAHPFLTLEGLRLILLHHHADGGLRGAGGAGGNARPGTAG